MKNYKISMIPKRTMKKNVKLKIYKFNKKTNNYKLWYLY